MLLTYLGSERRYKEEIDVLETLVRQRPDVLAYRTRLVDAYFNAGKLRERDELLKRTAGYFHQQRRWDEAAMAALGECCLHCKLYQPAIDYLTEAIAAHAQAAPRETEAETLSGYYADQADAYAELKKTAEAIDAASAAIVAAPRDSTERKRAESTLRTIVENASDLDEFVARLDRQAAETRQDNPMLRCAIGRTYLAKGDHARTIRQLHIAAELQPYDKETHEAILSCCTEQNDDRGTIDELLRWREAAALREREPDGLFDLAEALIHEQRWTEAAAVVQQLRETTWPAQPSYTPERLRQRIRRLEEQIGTSRDRL